MDNEEYFGRTAEEAAEFEDLGALSGAPAAEEPTSTDAAPSPATASLTLAAIEQQTGISYVSLQRYAQQFGDRLANVYDGTGRNRRYYPSAVQEFQRIKAEMSERRAAGAVASRPQAAQDADTPAPRRRGKSRSSKRKKNKPSTSKQQSRRAVKQTQPRHVARAQTIAPASPAASGAAAPVADLDRLAKIYQLRLQLKTLDEVTAFVAGWCTRIETEIKELEGRK